VAHLGVAHLVAKQQADGVDHRAGELLHAADGLLQVQLEALSSPSVIRISTCLGRLASATSLSAEATTAS
jgi:hypothetical protein